MHETPSRPLALRFLSGPHLGGTVRLRRGCSIVIGRQAGADLMLQDELVSRRHARLEVEGDEVLVEDLGSTNGTYLNGVRIARGKLIEGGRILVGGSILKLVAGEPSAAPAAPGPVPAAPTAAAEGPRDQAGRLEEVPVPDLLQLLANGRRSGLLVLESKGRRAELRIENGRLLACAIAGRGELNPRKAFLRLLTWRAGTFELKARPAPAGPATAGASIEALLAEGMQQLEGLRRLLPRLPGRLVCSVAPADATLDVDEDDRALLALAAHRGELQHVLDATRLSDLDAAQRLAALLTRGLLAPAS